MPPYYNVFGTIRIVFTHFRLFPHPPTSRRHVTDRFTVGSALRMPTDRHVVLHLRHHRDADFRQHPAGPRHGYQQAQQFPNVCPGSDAVVPVIITILL